MNIPTVLYKIRYSLLKSKNIRKYIYKSFYLFYWSFIIPYKASVVRKKPQIKTLFILSELGVWKTEALYKRMLEHPRFIPYIVVEPKTDKNEYDNNLIPYLKENGYKYYMLNESQTIKGTLHPDIIFIQRSYGTVLKKNNFYHNFYALFCYVNYAFHSTEEPWTYEVPLNNLAWQNYFENKASLEKLPKLLPNKGRNCLITGLTMTDLFLEYKEKESVWKRQNHPKKRIIWAPHHTISSQEWLFFSTFLKYASFMLEIATKYHEQVQFAFKPHPALRSKLNMIWGEEETNNYYHQWEIMENGQLEQGDYISLFMQSDAMIHDCSSFTIEYHHTLKPVMYLIKDNDHINEFNDFAQKAFKLHIMGKNEKDIEQFIIDIINDKDYNKEERKLFFERYLVPPNGISASENMIRCILDKNYENKLHYS